jgi:nitrate/TMAO reductase-like tetraheme cytochrome c subunit
MRILGVLFLLACGPDAIAPAVDSPVEPADTSSMTDSGITDEVAGYESAEACAECHPVHYDEWRQSMHAYAAKSPVFDAMAAKAYRDTAGEIGTFCTGCHSPFGDAEGEGGALVASQRSDLSREGISCDYCHTAVEHDGQIGNNKLINLPGELKLGPYADASDDEHPSLKSDFISSPEFCGSCHDVYKFPGLQIEQAYTEYASSPSAASGQRCQDCHMSPTPGVESARAVGPIAVVNGIEYPDRELSSHRFIGPDYSLIDDFPYPDDLEASAIAQEEYMGQVQSLLENSVQIRSVRAEMMDDSETAEVLIELESLVAGHNVPTGFTSERQLWLHVWATNRSGDVLWETGDLDAEGNLRDIHSHQVIQGEVEQDMELVNLQSKNVYIVRHHIDNGSLQSSEDRFETSAIFPFDAQSIVRYSLEPLEVREVRWEVDNLDDGATIHVELRYRSLPPYVLQALRLEELMDRVEIFTIDTAETTL